MKYSIEKNKYDLMNEFISYNNSNRIFSNQEIESNINDLY